MCHDSDLTRTGLFLVSLLLVLGMDYRTPHKNIMTDQVLSIGLQYSSFFPLDIIGIDTKTI